MNVSRITITDDIINKARHQPSSRCALREALLKEWPCYHPIYPGFISSLGILISHRRGAKMTAIGQVFPIDEYLYLHSERLKEWMRYFEEYVTSGGSRDKFREYKRPRTITVEVNHDTHGLRIRGEDTTWEQIELTRKEIMKERKEKGIS